jgi:hypothetical protein
VYSNTRQLREFFLQRYRPATAAPFEKGEEGVRTRHGNATAAAAGNQAPCVTAHTPPLYSSLRMTMERVDHPVSLTRALALGSACDWWWLRTSNLSLSLYASLSLCWWAGCRRLADEYYRLMRELWQPQTTAVAPSEFLSALWRLVPTFRGYQQQARARIPRRRADV